MLKVHWRGQRYSQVTNSMSFTFSLEFVNLNVLTDFSEGENTGFVFTGSLVLSHKCLTHLAMS